MGHPLCPDMSRGEKVVEDGDGKMNRITRALDLMRENDSHFCHEAAAGVRRKRRNDESRKEEAGRCESRSVVEQRKGNT